ncbi:MAG: hypothetical protein K2G44_01795 [Clostridia bacterium]|nr:hypothetical protein [Clostridia bacterium]
MKNFWKKFAVIGAVLCLMVTFCGVFTACGGDTNNGTYNVTVVDPDGNGVQGVMMKFCILDEEGKELNCELFTTDANGKIEAKLTTENYHVAIIGGIPAGYAAAEYMNGVSQLYTKNFKNNSYTITLTAE